MGVFGFDRFDNQFVDRRPASGSVIIGFAVSVSQCRRTHGPRVASVPGITWTAVIMSTSNVLLNTLASISYIFNRCESRQRTRHVYWNEGLTGNRQAVVEK